MSNLLSQASLVMIPSGYKEDVVYSQIPTDGSGDLSFTRASDGTRINSAGLVEVCPWNLLTYSEDLSNAIWTKQDSSITANATTAPNGTLTADKLVENTSTSAHSVWQANNLPNQTYTYSFYAKASERVWIYTRGDIGLNYFNVSTGVVGTTSAGATSTIENVGNGWYRCIVTKTFHPQFNTQIAISTADNIDSYTGDGTSGAFLWGAQLNIGSTAKPYFPTTDRLNVPRLTYQNGGGGCPSLLLEKQSTNLFTYSEQMDNSDWFKNNLTITANSTTSPDGTQNADLLDDGTASSTQHWIYQGTSFSNSTAYTISFYAKYVSRKYMAVNIYNGATSQYVVYDIQNGSVYGSTGDVTASITSVGNGWYRVVYTRTMSASGSPNFRIAMADDSGNETYTGSNKQVYLWGMQCEASSYVTSYIVSTSSSATRVADACSKTGISSLIGQTEGTIFLDAYFDDLDTVNFSISDGTSGNYVLIDSSSGAVVFALVQQGGATQATINTSASFYTVGARLKCAIAYKANDFAFYINGNLIGTDNSGTVPACDQIRFARWNGVNPATQRVNEVITFPTRLTNAELAQLTA